ncbi:hypothetical protein H0H87_008330 [Tephrocybe sp. NHM501043]|nr:hypothetical protein H0H87_008330 [Tephrocybe sp. NHM501043]
MRATQQALRLLDGQTCRARIAQHDGWVNAFVRTVGEAKTSAQGKGRLAGWPVAVKDSICTKDMATGCASRMLAGFEPGYDATVVRLLRAAGADVLGKTNCDEFGMGCLDERP